jgi:hypothetical protein
MENSEKKKYFPYPSDRPAKKFYIITNDNKKVYFGDSRSINTSQDLKVMEMSAENGLIYHVIVEMKIGVQLV